MSGMAFNSFNINREHLQLKEIEKHTDTASNIDIL